MDNEIGMTILVFCGLNYIVFQNIQRGLSCTEDVAFSTQVIRYGSRFVVVALYTDNPIESASLSTTWQPTEQLNHGNLYQYQRKPTNNGQ